MIAALALALLLPAQDNDALKKKILTDVEKRLKSEEGRLLKDIAAGLEKVGDTTTLEDYSVLERLREEQES